MAEIQNVRLSRAAAEFAPQILVSALIEKTSERLSFKSYQAFMNAVMHQDPAATAELAKLLGRSEAEIGRCILGNMETLKRKRASPFMDSDAYRLLKVATEAFLLVSGTEVNLDALGSDALRAILNRVDSPEPAALRAAFDDYLDTVDVTDKEADIFPVIEQIKEKIENDQPKSGVFVQKGSEEATIGELAELKRVDEAAANSDEWKDSIKREIDNLVAEQAVVNAKVIAEKIDRLVSVLQGNYKPEIDALKALQPAPGAHIIARSTRRFTLLPYLALIKRKLPDVGILPLARRDEELLGYRIAQEKLTNPCFIELIWSYWHEQGMLVQTLNAISRRFQNVSSRNGRDPLAMLEIGYLRPLNNLLWGYLQDEQHRLSLVRRTYEYDHHYGLTLEGAAVPRLRPADSRSKFLEAFHNLLYLANVFFRQDDDTTVRADAFPILNALKDVHMLLTMGQHNQFGDLTSTARGEMLMQQWLLARPEFRELLPTRESVVYPEPWMERVDAMKRLQGWLDTSVLHFHDLGVFGEQLLLSIRFIEWSAISDDAAAGLWARFWRSKIQGYIYAYRAVTGVDLTASPTEPQQARVRVLQPSELLRQRLESGNTAPALLPDNAAALLPSFRERRALRK